MNKFHRLVALKQIVDLIRDRDISALANAGRAKERTEAQLSALDHLPAATGLPLAAMAQVEAQYGLWAMERRAALNRQLARETAAWQMARSKAALAFGRADVVGKLASGSACPAKGQN